MSYAHGSEAPRLNHSNIDTIFQRIFKVFSCDKQNYESKISSWRRILMVQFCSTTNPQVPGLAHNFCWKIFWKNLTKFWQQFKVNRLQTEIQIVAESRTMSLSLRRISALCFCVAVIFGVSSRIKQLLFSARLHRP